jgi:hypothetical protein
MQANDLLRKARVLYDDAGTGLARQAGGAWRWGFVSGAEWMRSALAQLRNTPPAGPTRGFNRLGIIKYGLSSAAALACLTAAVWLEQPLLAVLLVPAFYAVEAQFVFLFPLALDQTPHVWRRSRQLTLASGGTLAVMGTVLPLAAMMLFGGLAGRGFVRSWCLGCLAVCIWYEELRNEMTGANPDDVGYVKLAQVEGASAQAAFGADDTP